MPLNKMPFGLIASNNLKLFASDNVCHLQVSQVMVTSSCHGLQSMYTLLVNKLASLHLGQMWSYKVGDGDHYSALVDSNTE